MDGLNVAAAGAGFVILALAFTQIWRLFREMRKERDYYRGELFKTMRLAEIGAGSAEKLVAAHDPANKESDRMRRLTDAIETLMGRDG